MGRKKVKDFVLVKDLEAADKVLEELAALNRRLETIKTRMNGAIDKAKAEANERTRPIEDRIKMLEGGLAQFAEAHKESLFSKKRSLDRVFGVFGFRRSHELKPLPKWNWKKVLDALSNKRKTEAIQVKRSVKKDELRAWPADELKEVGARIVKKDTFFYEIKAEELELRDVG